MPDSQASRDMPLRDDKRPPAERLAIRTRDGQRLIAVRYCPPERPRAQLVIAGATGVHQFFYRQFAEYARSRGYDAYTLDYRGIGLSAPTRLRGYAVDYLDWGRQDLAALIRTVRQAELPLYLVGHSFGGHTPGLLRPAELPDAMVSFGLGTGWPGWMTLSLRLRIWILWYALGPLLTRLYGFLPARWLGMGEDLPLGIYQQWRRWGRHPRFYLDEPQLLAELPGFDTATLPILAINAVDDVWAPPASRDAFLTAYRNARWTTRDIHPPRLGLRPIGHMGYFRAPAMPLWQDALDWFEALETRLP